MYIYGRIKKLTETVATALLGINPDITWALCKSSDDSLKKKYDLIALHYQPKDLEEAGCYIRIVMDELGYDTVLDNVRTFASDEPLEEVLRNFALDINNFESEERREKTYKVNDLGIKEDPKVENMVDSVLGKDGTFDKYINSLVKYDQALGYDGVAANLSKVAEKRSSEYKADTTSCSDEEPKEE